MPQYVLRLSHPPDQCPTSNSKVRELFVKVGKDTPQLAQKLGIKLLAGPLILGSEHEAVVVVDTDKVETVQEFIIQSGLVQWNSVRVTQAMSLEEAAQTLERVPPPLY